MRIEYVLDTHTWIWFMTSAPLAPSAVEALVVAGPEAWLWVPAIATWETSLLVQRGRLNLDAPLLPWLHAALALPRMRLAPLSPEIAAGSVSLPGHFPGDPADRLIVATARELSLPLITRERKILAYAAEGHLQVIAA